MVGYWISFALIAVAIVFGVPAFKIWLKSKTKITITPEIEQQANVRVVVYILFYLLCDLFYMSCFLKNLICKYIFGGLIMIIIFMNLSKSVSLPKERTGVERWGMIQDFIFGIVMSIYLIYIIPNKDVQNVVIPVISAVYGGIITLVGVVLTIKKSDKDRKEDEIKKAKPLVFVVDPRTISSERENPINRCLHSMDTKGTLISANKRNRYYTLPIIAISNADYSHSVLIGFRVNDNYHIYDVGQVLLKNSLFVMYNDFAFICQQEIKYVALLIKDMLDNIYELELNIEIEQYKKENMIQIVSGIELKETTLKIDTKNI